MRKKGGVFELYDIAADPTESKNLASEQPQVVKDLVARLEGWVRTLPTKYVKTKDKQD